MQPVSNRHAITDTSRKVENFKRSSGKNKHKSNSTYSKQAVEQAENMRNRGVTG